MSRQRAGELMSSHEVILLRNTRNQKSF